MKRKLMGLLAAVLCILTLAQPARAAGADLSIPVRIRMKGDVPQVPDQFILELKAEDTAFPMPTGAVDGTYTMTLRGAGRGHFPRIGYDRAGVYTYTIRQWKGRDPRCRYDDRVYALTVYVTNAGGGLETSAVLGLDGGDGKQTEAVFVNRYDHEPGDVPQTGDSSNLPLYGAMAGGSLLVLLLLARKREGKC